MPREPGAPWPEAAAKALEKARNESASPVVRAKWLGAVNDALERDYTLDTLPEHAVDPWNDPECEKLHAEWWALRIERQREIDASIAARADTEYLYDQPYEDKSRVRVAGPFTVDSLSPHRVPAVDVDDSLFDETRGGGRALSGRGERGAGRACCSRLPEPCAHGNRRLSRRWSWTIWNAAACNNPPATTGSNSKA